MVPAGPAPGQDHDHVPETATSPPSAPRATIRHDRAPPCLPRHRTQITRHYAHRKYHN
jgi:hypothetical protein